VICPPVTGFRPKAPAKYGLPHGKYGHALPVSNIFSRLQARYLRYILLAVEGSSRLPNHEDSHRITQAPS
jgi:hypothetical protein